MKRMLCLILALGCLMTLLPATASAAQTKKLIALTFDDGPGGPTPRLLDGLAERGVRVTFFMLGQCAANAPKTVRRAFEEGHEIASHTYKHYQLTAKDDAVVREEVERTDATLDEILGMDLDYLIRPPYGATNERVLGLLGAPAIIWSVDTLDWKYRDATHVCNEIVRGAYNGAIVLCHDIHSTTVDGALAAIDILLARGYEFVTVSELYRRRGVTMENGVRYNSCKLDESDLGGVEPPDASVEQVLGGYCLTLASAQGARLYYRLDEDETFYEYTEPVILEGGHMVTAYAAFRLNGGRSEATRVSTGEAVTAPKPVVRVSEGCIVLSFREGAGAFYTTDGSSPTAASALYSQPIAAFDGTLRILPACPGGSGTPYAYTVCREGWLLGDVLAERKIERTAGCAIFLGIYSTLDTVSGK